MRDRFVHSLKDSADDIELREIVIKNTGEDQTQRFGTCNQFRNGTINGVPYVLAGCSAGLASRLMWGPAWWIGRTTTLSSMGPALAGAAASQRRNGGGPCCRCGHPRGV